MHKLIFTYLNDKLVIGTELKTFIDFLKFPRKYSRLAFKNIEGNVKKL